MTVVAVGMVWYFLTEWRCDLTKSFPGLRHKLYYLCHFDSLICYFIRMENLEGIHAILLF
jgi:hypothetical protein